MRLDKFLTHAGVATRSEAAAAARRGQILLNGEPCKKADVHIDAENAVVHFCGELVEYREFTYIMLNKPDGYISATEDSKEKTVITLLPPQLQRINLFPCGRLDKDTVGLLILTNDGKLAHKLLSPRRQIEKKYAFVADIPLTPLCVEKLQSGVTLDDGYNTLPARLTLNSDSKSGEISIVEGKYHQIKRMFEAVGNKIVFLERVAFATLSLDSTLKRGEWRFLENCEIQALKDAVTEKIQKEIK